jgi:serine protease Do
LSRTIAQVPVDKKVTIKVLRNGKERSFGVQIVKRTEEKETVAAKGRSEEKDLGMSVSSITPELARQLGISETEGVVVVAVEDGGPANQAEVEEGDLILEIDHKPIKTIEDYQEQIGKVKEGETVSLLLRRKTGFLALNITR